MSLAYESSTRNARKYTIRWRMISLIFILYTINCIDRISLSLAMPDVTKEFNLSPEVQGIILSSFFGHIVHFSYQVVI